MALIVSDLSVNIVKWNIW